MHLFSIAYFTRCYVTCKILEIIFQYLYDYTMSTCMNLKYVLLSKRLFSEYFLKSDARMFKKKIFVKMLDSLEST